MPMLREWVLECLEREEAIAAANQVAIIVTGNLRVAVERLKAAGQVEVADLRSAADLLTALSDRIEDQVVSGRREVRAKKTVASRKSGRRKAASGN